MGEFKIWVDEGMRLGRGTTLAGEARVAGDGACRNLSLKIAAKSVRAAMVSSPKLSMSLLQIDTPEASVQISRAAQNLGVLGIADCNRGLLESDYVSFVA
jgi:hypothetical protein